MVCTDVPVLVSVWSVLMSLWLVSVCVCVVCTDVPVLVSLCVWSLETLVSSLALVIYAISYSVSLVTSLSILLILSTETVCSFIDFS